MSHHYSGPDFGFPRGDARLDLTDLYAFPVTGERCALIMNVHPSSSIQPQTATTPEPFSTNASYEFLIDNNTDAVADVAYRVNFTAAADGKQFARVARLVGFRLHDPTAKGQVLLSGAPVSVGTTPEVAAEGHYRFFAGWRSDPFFFDPLGALNGLNFTGSDFFADKDVCSIALEIPNTDLGAPSVGIWARTIDYSQGNPIQADRGALPAQSIFLPGDARGEYLAGDPSTDERFIGIFAHSLEHVGGYTPGNARRVAQSILPDILRFDPRRPAAYPGNGRTLTDDVLDHFLALLTNGRVRSDGVGPHADLLSEFPYLGSPHTVRPHR